MTYTYSQAPHFSGDFIDTFGLQLIKLSCNNILMAELPLIIKKSKLPHFRIVHSLTVLISVFCKVDKEMNKKPGFNNNFARKICFTDRLRVKERNFILSVIISTRISIHRYYNFVDQFSKLIICWNIVGKKYTQNFLIHTQYNRKNNLNLIYHIIKHERRQRRNNFVLLILFKQFHSFTRKKS